MVALGQDFEGVSDLNPYFPLVDGPLATAQSVAVSILHRPGVLWWAPERGFGLPDRLHRTEIDLNALAVGIQTEAEQDERVAAAEARAETPDGGRTINIELRLELTTDDDAVTLTLEIDAVDGAINASIV